uniref:ENTH domain containing 1 n=1 Tax=Rousettus aegyptiacus TaxID=9407 RepID=A0A7J8JCV4_ROUAE|nr:ENTH domain containing 1 [Rousettus aegyptiacus]
MNMLWQRLNDHGKNWRHVYKSLTLMDYLIKNGSKKVIQHCREGFCNLQTLKDFQHVDEAGKDQGWSLYLLFPLPGVCFSRHLHYFLTPYGSLLRKVILLTSYHIREKSKQVITLLMDEQLLHKEREVACRTRRRTSHSMTFPKRLPGTGNSPTACASAPTPETPASEKKQKLLKVARLHKKKNASKAGFKQEQCQDIQLSGGAVLSQETLPLEFNAWKSTEKDLMLFYEDDPEPLSPTIPPTIISSTVWLSEGQAGAGNLWDADAMPTPSEKNPSLQANVDLDKKSYSTSTNTVTAGPLQMPLEKQSTAKSFETLTTLPAFWSSSRKEHISPNLRVSKSDSTFHNQASVETLYVSPSFKTFDSVEKIVINKNLQEPTQPSTVQTDDENLKTLTTLVSTTSEGTSSFSALSVSSPDSASPEKSVPVLPPALAGPSFWTLSHPQSSAFFKDKDKTASACCPFGPMGAVSSDEEESDNLSLPGLLPANSDPAKKKISRFSSHNWVEFSTQNVDHFTSMSCSTFQTTEGLPRETEANSSIPVLLGEVKNAIVKLHEDLSMVIRELSVINTHLVNMSGNSLQISMSLPFPQSSEESSDQI